ncbi:4-(cytidine 5'-diphospho)-2-C-methyl-D-erythritol kinase [Paradesulfitobacterium aromaticivorans]
MTNSFKETFAYAKINLALAITGRRADGYHELQSVMQSISLYDVIRVWRRGDGITCRCGELSGPFNLAYRAAEKFVLRLGKTAGIEIEIEKKIPLEAGLAGGSSNAAAVLRVLNELYGSPLSGEELRELAGSIGADVAFCLDGGTMWATGRGEILAELPPAPRLELVVAKPLAGVNTKEAYRRFDEEGQTGSLNQDDWIQALTAGRPEQVAALLSNDLEEVSIRMVPEIGHIKRIMLKSGCYGALMSGSGSAVFGLAYGQEQALTIARELRAQGHSEVWTASTNFSG